MRKWFAAVSATALLLLCTILFTGCLKDEVLRTYTIYAPVYKSLTQVRAEMKSSQPQQLQQTGKLYVYGKYIFLNEVSKGIHIIDNSNPAQPKNISFVPIPGNVDLAVKGNYLYADSYSDLVVFDISTPTNVAAKKFLNNVFPHNQRYYSSNTTNPDSVMVVVGYTQKDTTVSNRIYANWRRLESCANCMSGGDLSSPVRTAAPTKGISGSMARFTITNDYLYSVSIAQLFSFDITAADDPQLVNTANVGWNIETIYPFKDKLFIGSSSGMFIYDIANAAQPSLLGQFSHVRSCDPVIADDNYAYVTLRSGTQCQGFTNQMEVLDIRDLSKPVLTKTYPLTNPHGLSKDGNTLFICDGKDGLKVYDAANVTNLQLVKTISSIEPFDVIAYNNIAMVVAKDGLYQYDYSDRTNIRLLSKLTIAQ